MRTLQEILRQEDRIWATAARVHREIRAARYAGLPYEELLRQEEALANKARLLDEEYRRTAAAVGTADDDDEV